MNQIYQTEDAIEEVKFKLAALKIETGFSMLHELIKNKKSNYFHSVLFKLQLNKNRQLLHNCFVKFEHFSNVIETIEERRKRNALNKLICIWQKEERKNSSQVLSSRQRIRSSGERSEVDYNSPKAMSLIEEENWKDKLTMEELQIKCDYYSAKIKEVEKCFSNFFQTVKQDE